MNRDRWETEQFVDVVDDQPLIKRRALEDNEMDITPMIDITFLLLIFFLVAGKLDQQTPVELPPARHGTAVSVKGSVTITLTQGDAEQANVYLGDGANPASLVDGRDPLAQEAAIVRYLEEQLASGEAKEHVVIKAEGAVKHRDVARVSAAVGKVSRELYVAVMEVR
jgi:biopolymer transport protein ExbD